MFLSRNKNNNVYPSKPQFYYIKVGFKGVKINRHVFVMCLPFSFLYLFVSAFTKGLSLRGSSERLLTGMCSFIS